MLTSAVRGVVRGVSVIRGHSVPEGPQGGSEASHGQTVFCHWVPFVLTFRSPYWMMSIER